MTKSYLSRANQVLIIIATATLIAAMLFSTLDQPRGGPVTEASGVVQSFMSFHSPATIAIVRLKDNSIIKADVVTGGSVQQGQTVHMHIYRSVFTKTSTYEIYRTETFQQ